MEHYNFIWKTENFYMFCKLISKLQKIKSKKRREKIINGLEMLKRGYRTFLISDEL